MSDDKKSTIDQPDTDAPLTEKTIIDSTATVETSGDAPIKVTADPNSLATFLAKLQDIQISPKMVLSSDNAKGIRANLTSIVTAMSNQIDTVASKTDTPEVFSSVQEKIGDFKPAQVATSGKPINTKPLVNLLSLINEAQTLMQTVVPDSTALGNMWNSVKTGQASRLTKGIEALKNSITSQLGSLDTTPLDVITYNTRREVKYKEVQVSPKAPTIDYKKEAMEAIINSAHDQVTDDPEFKKRLKLDGKSINAVRKNITNFAKGRTNESLIQAVDSKKPSKAAFIDVENAQLEDGSMPIVSFSMSTPKGDVDAVRSDYADLLNRSYKHTKDPIFKQVLEQIDQSGAQKLNPTEFKKYLARKIVETSNGGNVGFHAWFGGGKGQDGFKTDEDKIKENLGGLLGKKVGFSVKGVESLFAELVSGNSRLKGQDLSSVADILGVTGSLGDSAHGAKDDTTALRRIYTILDEIKKYKIAKQKNPDVQPSAIASMALDQISVGGLRARVEEYRRNPNDNIADLKLIQALNIKLGEEFSNDDIKNVSGTKEYIENDKKQLIQRIRARNLSKLLTAVETGSIYSRKNSGVSEGSIDGFRQLVTNDLFRSDTGVGQLETLNKSGELFDVERLFNIPSTSSPKDTSGKGLNPSLKIPQLSDMSAKLAIAINEDLVADAGKVAYSENGSYEKGYKGPEYVQKLLSLFKSKYAGVVANSIKFKGVAGLLDEDSLTQTFESALNFHLPSTATETSRLQPVDKNTTIDTSKKNSQSIYATDTSIVKPQPVATGDKKTNIDFNTALKNLQAAFNTTISSHLTSNYSESDYKQFTISDDFMSLISSPTNELSTKMFKPVAKTGVYGMKDLMGHIASAYIKGGAGVAKNRASDIKDHILNNTDLTLDEYKSDLDPIFRDYYTNRNFNRGFAHETSPETQKLLSDTKLTPIKADIAVGYKATNENEHHLVAGGISGHPDFIGTQDISGVSIPTLLDFKSPTKQIPSNINNLSELLKSSTHGNSSLQWLSQIVGYAQVFSKDVRDKLQLGIVAGKPGEESKLYKASYNSLLSGGAGEKVKSLMLTIEKLFHDLTIGGKHTGFLQIGGDRDSGYETVPSNKAINELLSRINPDIPVTPGMAPSKVAKTQLAEYLMDNMSIKGTAPVLSKDILQSYAYGQSSSDTHDYSAFFGPSGLNENFEKLWRAAYPSNKSQDEIVAEFATRYSKMHTGTMSRLGGHKPEDKDLDTKVQELINGKPKKPFVDSRTSMAYAFTDAFSNDIGIESNLDIIKAFRDSAKAEDAKYNTFSNIREQFNNVSRTTSGVKLTSFITPKVAGGNNLDLFRGLSIGKGGPNTPDISLIDYELQKRIAAKHKAAYYSSMVKKSELDQADSARGVLSSTGVDLPSASTFNVENKEQLGKNAAYSKIQWAAAQQVVDAYSSIVKILNKNDTKLKDEFAQRVISLKEIENELINEKDNRVRGRLIIRGARLQSSLPKDTDLNNYGIGTDFTELMKPKGRGAKALKQAIMAELDDQNSVVSHKAYAQLEINSNKDNFGDKFAKRKESVLAEEAFSAKMIELIEKDPSISESSKKDLIQRYSKKRNENLLKISAYNQLIPGHTDEEQDDDSVLPSIVGERKDLAKKHQNNLQKQFKSVEHFGLTAENLKSILSSSGALVSLEEDSTIGNIFEHDIVDFAGSKQLQGLKTANNLKNSSLLTGPMYQKQLEQYAAGLVEQVAGLGTSEVGRPNSMIYDKARAAESALIRYNGINSKIEQQELLSQSVSQEDYDTRDKLKTELDGHKEYFKGLADPENRLKALKEREITTESLDVFKPSYTANKADKLNELQDHATALKLAVSSGDMSLTPDLLDNFAKLHKEYKKAGHTYTPGGLTLTDIMSKYDKDKSLSDNFGIEKELTTKGDHFVVAAQTYQSNTANLSGANKFDALIMKEKAALAAVTELEAAFIAIKNPDLGTIEQEFKNLLELINADITALNKLEAAKKAAGGTLEAHDEEKLEAGRKRVAENIEVAKNKRKIITNKDRENELVETDWVKQVELAGSDRQDIVYKNKAKALSINAQIESSRDDKNPNKFNATHAEFEEAIRLAKELESRGIKTGHNTGIGITGLYSSNQLETMMSASGFKGRQHLSFTEGLVDQAAWKVQFGGAGAVLGGMSALTVGGFSQAKQFEEAMKNVELVSQASTIQLDQLKNKVVELSTSFTVTPAQLSEGLVVLGQAGYKAAESLQLLGPIAQLATATMSDLKQAADITTTVLMAFDQPVANAANVANTLAAATIESKLELSSLGTVLNYVASTAYMAGMSLEETETAMGIMSNAGIKASTIGTSLRSIFGTLIAPTAAFSAELARIGLTADDVNPQISSMSTILQRLSFKGFDVENAFQGLDKRIAGNISTLMSQADKWEDFQSRVTGTDTASAMAHGQMDTFGAQSKRLSNTFDTTRISLMSGALEPLKTFASLGADSLKVLGDAADTSFGRTIMGIGSTTAAIGGFMSVLAGLGSAGRTILPSAFAGIRTNLATWVVPKAENVNKYNAIFSAEGSIGKRILAPNNIGNLPPSQQRMHETIASLAGVAFNPWALVGTAALTTTMLGYQWLKGGDKTPIGTGKDRMLEAKRSSDSVSNYISTMEKAAVQQQKIQLFSKSDTSSAISSFEDSLLSTGVFAGKDIIGTPVMIGSKSDKNRGKVTLSVKRDSFSAATYADVAKDVYKNTTSVEEVNAMVNHAIKGYSSPEKAMSEEGRNATSVAASNLVRKFKSAGIFYNEERVAEQLNTLVPGSDLQSREIRSSVLAQQEEALVADDSKTTAAKQALNAYNQTLKMAGNTELYLQMESNKKLEKQGIKSTKSLSKEELVVAKSVPSGLIKTLVTNYKADENFNKTTSGGGTHERLFAEYQDKYDKGEVSAEQLMSIIQYIAAQSGSKKGTNAVNDYKKGMQRIGTKEGLAEQQVELVKLTDDAIVVMPEKIMSKEIYSEARNQYMQRNTLTFRDFLNANDRLKAAKEKKSLITDTSSDAYKVASKNVEVAELDVAQHKPKLEKLMEESYRYIIPNAKTSRTFLKQTRGALGVVGETGLASLSSDQYDDFAAKVDKIRVDYKQKLNSELVRNNEPIKAKLQLQYDLEIKDTLEEMVLKANQSVFKFSDKLSETFRAGLKSAISLKDIKLDATNVEISIDAANKMANKLLAPRVEVGGYETNFTKFSNDYSRNKFSVGKTTNTANIPMYSQDSIFLDTADEKIKKLNTSLKHTLDTLNTTKTGLNSVLAQDKAGLSNIADTDIGKEKLLAAEEKYNQERVAANQKAFSSISQIINNEIQLREQLIRKIADSKEEISNLTKAMSQDSKDLKKAAGFNIQEDPKKLLKSMEEKETEYNKRVNMGDKDGASKIYRSMQAEEIAEFKSGKYAPYDIMQADKAVERMKAKNPELNQTYEKPLKERIAKTDETINTSIDAQAKIMKDSIELNLSHGNISKQQATLFQEQFVKRLEAAKGNPELAKSIIADYNANPVLKTKLTDETDVGTIIGHLTGVLKESFGGLNTSVAGVSEEMKKLLERLREYNDGPSSEQKDKKDVKYSLADEVIIPAAKDAMALYGSNTGKWVSRIPGLKDAGNNISNYWNGQKSNILKQNEKDPTMDAIYSAMDPMTFLGFGAYGTTGKALGLATSGTNMQRVSQTIDYIRKASKLQKIGLTANAVDIAGYIANPDEADIIDSIAATNLMSIIPGVGLLGKSSSKLVSKFGVSKVGTTALASKILKQPSREQAISLIGEDAAKAIGIDTFEVPKLVGEYKSNGVAGWNDASKNEIHYTDRKSLLHELLHSKIRAEGKKFSGENTFDREMAEEFEVNKRMVKMGELDRSEVENRFGLGIHTDTSNMSSTELNSMRKSRAADTYAKNKPKYSLDFSDELEKNYNAQPVWKRKTSEAIHTVLPAITAITGATIAGIAATPETLGVATIPAAAAGGALMYGAGQQTADLIDNHVLGLPRKERNKTGIKAVDNIIAKKVDPFESSIANAAYSGVYDITEGLGMETLGMGIAGVVKIASPYVATGLNKGKSVLTPMVKTHDGQIAGRFLKRKENFTNQKLYHGGPLAENPNAFKTTLDDAFFITPDLHFAGGTAFGGKQGSGIIEMGLEKGTKVFDFRTASKKDWLKIRKALSNELSDPKNVDITLEQMKLGNWHKIEKGVGKTAIEKSGYDAATMSEAGLKYGTDGKAVFNRTTNNFDYADPSLTLAVFNKSKIKPGKTVAFNHKPKTDISLEDLTLSDFFKDSLPTSAEFVKKNALAKKEAFKFNADPLTGMYESVQKVVTPARWNELKSLSPNKMLKNLTGAESQQVVAYGSTKLALASAIGGGNEMFNSLVMTPSAQNERDILSVKQRMLATGENLKDSNMQSSKGKDIKLIRFPIDDNKSMQNDKLVDKDFQYLEVVSGKRLDTLGDAKKAYSDLSHDQKKDFYFRSAPKTTSLLGSKLSDLTRTKSDSNTMNDVDIIADHGKAGLRNYLKNTTSLSEKDIDSRVEELHNQNSNYAAGGSQQLKKYLKSKGVKAPEIETTVRAFEHNARDKSAVALNPLTAMTSNSVVDTVTRQAEQETQLSIMRANGANGLTSYLRRQGVTDQDAIKARVEEVSKQAKSTSILTNVNNGIQSEPNSTKIGKNIEKRDDGTYRLTNVFGKQVTVNKYKTDGTLNPEHAMLEDTFGPKKPRWDTEDAKKLLAENTDVYGNYRPWAKANVAGIPLTVKNSAITKEMAANAKKREDGGYDVETTTGSKMSVGEYSTEALFIEKEKAAKKAKEPKYSLQDSETAPLGSATGIIDSNNRLIASLDSLRTSIEASQNKPTGTSNSTAGPISVSVNAPVTVSSQTGGSQDVSNIVSKICTDFFNNEFNTRYVKAVQTVTI